jgi:Protein of unknown function (DUF1186)
MTNSTSFKPPVDKLLSFGDCYETRNNWPNYITELGLDSQHIPDLIKMAVDKELHEADEENPQTSAGVHAWRALGQLHAEAAIEPLMSLFHEVEDNDWVSEELPKVYGMIGSTAIKPLSGYLSDSKYSVYPRTTAINSLGEIAKKHSDSRQHCIAALTNQLKLFTQNHEELNGFIVSSLINLKASESAGVIKSAFAAKAVCEDIVGNWDNVRQYLGVSDDEIEEFRPEEITITPEETTVKVEFEEEINEPTEIEIEKQPEPIAPEINMPVVEKTQVEKVPEPEPTAEETTVSVEEEIEAELIPEEPITPKEVQAEAVVEELIPSEQVTIFVEPEAEPKDEVVEEVVEEIKPEIKGFGRSSEAKDKSKDKGKMIKKKKSSSRGFNQL